MTEEVDVTETEEVPAEEPVQLSLQDMATMVQIIDLCSERGAFKGTELEPVGVVRGRIARFLNAAAPPAAEEGATEASEEQAA